MKYNYTGSLVLYNNSLSDILEVINSFFRSKNNCQLYIIDNSDKSNFSELSNLDRIHYIKTNKNLGFGAGHNIAINQIIQDESSRYHFILNPDISFKSGTLENLIEVMLKDEKIGIVSPKIINSTGNQEFLCKLIPTPMDLLIRLTPYTWFRSSKDRFQLKELDYNKPINAPYLSGCFMLLDLYKIKNVGVFDEQFFMYPEDIDLTRRMNEKYSTIYWPKENIIHQHAKASFKSLKMFRIHTINMIKYFNKWGWFIDDKRRRQNQQTIKQTQ